MQVDQTRVVQADDDDVVWELETPLDEHLVYWDPEDEDDEPVPARVRRARRPRGSGRGRRARMLAGVVAALVVVVAGVLIAGRGDGGDEPQDVASDSTADEDEDEERDRRGFAPRSTTTVEGTTSTSVPETTTTVAPTAEAASVPGTDGSIPGTAPGTGPGEGSVVTAVPPEGPSDPDTEPSERTHVVTGVAPARVAAGGTVEVRWRQSSPSGITFATFLIQHDATGNQLPSSATCPAGNATERWAGDAHDASYVATCRTPAGAASGRYTVTAHLEHADGTISQPVVGSLEITGGPADTSPPVLVSSSVSPESGPPGAIVTLRWRFTSPPGMHFSTFFLRLGDQYVDGGPDCRPGDEVPIRSGTAHDAAYRATCNTSGLAPGTYELEAYAQDQSGNLVVAPAGTLTVTAP